MMHFYRTAVQISILIGVGLFLTGCNPATRGWSSNKGGSVSSARLVAAKHKCGYQRARGRAIRLLDASGNRKNNRQRAARLLRNSEQCMRKYGMYYKIGRAFGIGQTGLK